MVATKTSMLTMFLDRTAGEEYSEGRLTTQETESGSVALIGYGWLKLAEYDESRDVVTVFGGHRAIKSRTVSRYLNDVVRRAEARGRDVVLSGSSPTVDTPNSGVRFIGNYITFGPNRSPVEQDAVDEVVSGL